MTTPVKAQRRARLQALAAADKAYLEASKAWFISVVNEREDVAKRERETATLKTRLTFAVSDYLATYPNLK